MATRWMRNYENFQTFLRIEDRWPAAGPTHATRARAATPGRLQTPAEAGCRPDEPQLVRKFLNGRTSIRKPIHSPDRKFEGRSNGLS